MTITLPYANQKRAIFRVLTAPKWDNGNATWTIQPMDRSGKNGFGFYVEEFSRVCLPAVGEAKIRFRFGKIDGVMVGLSADSSAVTSGLWNPANDTATAPDLRGYEVRIQAAPYVADPSSAAWATVWVGVVENQEDEDWPGAAFPSGTRIYRCIDSLYRTSRWMLNKHVYYREGSPVALSPGHPGYNVTNDLGKISGNRDPSGSFLPPYGSRGDSTGPIYAHYWPGAGNIWTDKEAVEHALVVTRPIGEPVFTLNGATDLYSAGTGNAWKVDENDSAWDFLIRVCKPTRARGVAFLDWADDSSAPTGPLTLRIAVRSQFKDDVNVSFESYSSTISVTYNGATTNATTVAVDLTGDHRNLDDVFSLGDPYQFRYDYVESVGERIQALVTLSYFDSVPTLEKQWATAQEAAFAALSPTKRIDETWKYVWQLHGIPKSWTGIAGSHDNSSTVPGATRCDYRCKDSGYLFGTALEALSIDFSPLTTEVMHDIPLLEGYTYTGGLPARKDSSTDIKIIPPRRPPLILLRTAANRYLTGDEVRSNGNNIPLTIQVNKEGILVYAPGDVSDQGAFRIVANTSTASLQSGYNLSALGVTVGLKLGHRVRMATGDIDGRRKLTIEHNDIHLWLAHPGAIWDVDSANRDSNGSPGLRQACTPSDNKTPGILRDDRAALAQAHALACSWYLQNRRTATWGLNACGFLPSFTVADANGNDGSTVTYPTIGKLVTTITAAGQIHTINTPITSVHYYREDDRTIWVTDWGQLDYQ